MPDRLDDTAHETLSIGDLAERSGLSKKALRMYDDSGLLPAQSVDPFTGYRRYGAHQVARARLIAALRSTGMGLSRIAVVVSLPAADAAQEIRSWWLQEQADSLSRGAAVAVLLDQLGHDQEEITMPTTTFDTRIACRSHRGRVRQEQQDAVLSRDLPHGAVLVAVADGFGTGSTIAGTALTVFGDTLARALEQEPAGFITAAMQEAWSACEALVAGDGGTTLTAAMLCGDTLHVAHIGDTRLMLLGEGLVEPVTNDHSHVRSLVAAGRLTAEEAAHHPDRATLNRALAEGAPMAPDMLARTVSPGARVVLLSDGIHAVVPAAAVADIVMESQEPGEAADQLVRAARACCIGRRRPGQHRRGDR